MKNSLITAAMVVCLGIGMASSTAAGDLYSTGDITWDTTTATWSSSAGGPYDQTWGSNSNAIFETNGAVTLGEAISVSNLTFMGPNMTITNSVLSFASGAVISNVFYYPNGNGSPDVTTISCGISGSPDLGIVKGDNGSTKGLTFSPSANSTQTLGEIIMGHPGGSQTLTLRLAGASSNNTVETIHMVTTHAYGHTAIKEGPGKWTVNGDISKSSDVYPIAWRVDGGTMIVNGSNIKGSLSYIENGTLGGDFTNGPLNGSQSGTEVRGGGILSPGDGGIGTMTFNWGTSGSARSFKFSDNSTVEYDVNATTNDIIDITHSADSTAALTLDLDNFILKLQDAAGGESVLARNLPVFTYDSEVTVDTNGFGNTTANFDTSGLDSYWLTNNLSLVDDAAGSIYVSGLSRPPMWNTAVSDLTASSASLNGTLLNSSTNWDVYVHWGETDGTNNPAAWDSSAYVGSWTNVPDTNVSYSATSLSSPQTYYYTFRASNSSDIVWASPSIMFATLAPPEVNNSTGAVSLSETSASLSGEMIVGGQADAWLCWGDNDGGVTSTSNWDNVVSMGTIVENDPFSTTASGLETNTTYFYRCFVTNALGNDWSDDAETFSGTPDSGDVGSGRAIIAIYTHGTLGDNVVNPATGADYDLIWDTTLREDAGYTLGAGTSNVTAEAGHHLVMHNARYDCQANVNNRREIQQYIVSEGSPSAIGWGQSYIRAQNGQDECIASGGGIIELASSGDISIQAHRTDSRTNDDTDRIADASGFMLLKLDDSWDYCRLSRNSDQTGPTTGTYVPVNYNVQDELDTDSFAHTAGESNITLKVAGHYLVFANTFINCTVDRTALIQRLTLDGSPIDGSTTTVYIRGNQEGCSDGAAALGMIIETTSANQLLRVEGALAVNRSPSTYKADKTAITIAKLPDTGDYIRLDDSGTDNFNPSSATALGWDTEDEIDATGFTHSDSNITAAVDSDYLFLTALYESNDSGQREFYWQRWSTNGAGSPITYANSGGFGRDTGGADEVGNFGGILLNMSNGETIEVISQQLGNSGTLSADDKGMQGVRLDSIFGSTGIANLAPTNIQASDAVLNASLTVGGNTNYAVYVHFGTSDGGTNFGWGSGYFSVGSYTNSNATNETYAVSYLKTGLDADTAYWYTFRASNDTGNAWAAPSWAFSSGPPTGIGSVFLFK